MPEFNYNSANPGPCCQKIEDMINYARPMIGRWPPFHKYTIGEDIMREMYLMLRLATRARLKYMNKSTLADLDISKAMLEVLVKSANDIEFTDRKGNKRRLLTDHSYGVWSGYIEEIGKLIGGWMKTVNDRKNKNKGNVP